MVRLPGSHHFNSDYAMVTEAVSQFIRSVVSQKRP
jgi:type IV secretory pathway VirJ component